MKATDNGFYEGVIISGFGGQGIILTGKLLAQTAMNAGKEVTYMPAYGAEVRGGTSNCTIVISEEPIASPVISAPDSLIIMNKASLEKFAPRIKEKGLLIYNSSLINQLSELNRAVDILPIPVDDIAVELGSPKSANMVALGAYLQKRGLFDVDAAGACLPDVLAERYHKTIPVNIQALHRGSEFARKA